MNPSEAIVRGTLQPDGTLRLDEPPNLPPGRVEVIVKSTVGESGSPGLRGFLRRLREAEEPGPRGRERAAIDAEIHQMRQEWDDHDRLPDLIRQSTETRPEGG